VILALGIALVAVDVALFVYVVAVHIGAIWRSKQRRAAALDRADGRRKLDA
jgi:hypothetical protein